MDPISNTIDTTTVTDSDHRTARNRSDYDLISVRKMTRKAREKIVGMREPEDVVEARPQVRADCLAGGMNEARPCPYVGCKYHLYLEVTEETGALQVNKPELEPWQLEESCALDVADKHQGITLELAGELLGRTRERVRQIETAAIDKVKAQMEKLGC